jgi:hypothetical protein
VLAIPIANFCQCGIGHSPLPRSLAVPADGAYNALPPRAFHVQIVDAFCWRWTEWCTAWTRMLECASIDSWERCLMFVCMFLSAEKAKFVDLWRSLKWLQSDRSTAPRAKSNPSAGSSHQPDRDPETLPGGGYGILQHGLLSLLFVTSNLCCKESEDVLVRIGVLILGIVLIKSANLDIWRLGALFWVTTDNLTSNLMYRHNLWHAPA